MKGERELTTKEEIEAEETHASEHDLDIIEDIRDKHYSVFDESFNGPDSDERTNYATLKAFLVGGIEAGIVLGVTLDELEDWHPKDIIYWGGRVSKIILGAFSLDPN